MTSYEYARMTTGISEGVFEVEYPDGKTEKFVHDEHSTKKLTKAEALTRLGRAGFRVIDTRNGWLLERERQD